MRTDSSNRALDCQETRMFLKTWKFYHLYGLIAPKMVDKNKYPVKKASALDWHKSCLFFYYFFRSYYSRQRPCFSHLRKNK